MLQHFFVSPGVIQAGEICLSGPLVHQMQRVLRLGPGDRVVLLDDTGWAYEVELTGSSHDSVAAQHVRRWQPQTEPSVAITLYQALPKGHQFDLILQKATEMGVATIVPLITQRCIARGQGNLQRWHRIVREAAEQSGRARLPQVEATQPFAATCAAPPEGTLALLACLGPAARPLREALQPCRATAPREIRLYIGPEGGFAPQELQQARAAGIELVSLGPRVLRTETAALALLSLVLYELGDTA